MLLSLSTVAWVLGSVLFTLAFQRLRAANPDQKIPLLIGRPAAEPGGVFIQRAVAILLMLPGVYAWSDVVGSWVLLLFLIGSAPAVILNIRHNRHSEDAAGLPPE
jgi:hypothetical protein